MLLIRVLYFVVVPPWLDAHTFIQREHKMRHCTPLSRLNCCEVQSHPIFHFDQSIALRLFLVSNLRL